MGLRSVGPVWSRANDFGEGVPYLFPHSPDTGSGLTEYGKALVRACNQLGILVDVSHLNEKGFWEIATLSTAPLVATHCNAHVGFGADLDGAQIPSAVGDVAGLPRVVAALRDAGFDDASLEKIGHGNWLRVLGQTWKAA